VHAETLLLVRVLLHYADANGPEVKRVLESAEYDVDREVQTEIPQQVPNSMAVAG
jgi:hypothetical protein